MNKPIAKLRSGLSSLLRDYEDIWCRLKPTELRSLWDPAEDAPFYIAEEIAEPIYDWPTLEQYWADAEQILIKFSIRTRDLRCKEVAPGLAVLNFVMHWNGVLRGLEHNPLGLDVRVSALARDVQGEWRFCHYIESPLGPLPYLMNSYSGNVDKDFL
ncbi:MAG: hypothetical protein AAGH76_06340 [Pseudomonadota bacterium]